MLEQVKDDLGFIESCVSVDFVTLVRLVAPSTFYSFNAEMEYLMGKA